MDEFRVTGEFCIAGNPTKAWLGTTGEDDTEHVPDDVWQEQSHTFGTLDEAKDFIRGLNPTMSTHIALLDADGTTLVYMDSDADHLDEAAPGVIPPSQREPEPTPGAHVVDETLTPYAPQEA